MEARHPHTRCNDFLSDGSQHFWELQQQDPACKADISNTGTHLGSQSNSDGTSRWVHKATLPHCGVKDERWLLSGGLVLNQQQRCPEVFESCPYVPASCIKAMCEIGCLHTCQHILYYSLVSNSHVWLNVICTVHYDGLYCGSVRISKCVRGCHRLILLSGDPACTLKASEACWASITMPSNTVAKHCAAHMQFHRWLNSLKC